MRRKRVEVSGREKCEGGKPTLWYKPLMIDSACEEQKMAGSPQYMRRGAEHS